MTTPRLAKSFIFYIATILFLVVGVITTPQLKWYATLTLPVWAPVPTIIAVIWCVLFYSTALSLATFWDTNAPERRFSMVAKLYALNALCMLLWNVLFFGFHAVGAAFFAAITVLLTIIILMLTLRATSVRAALLLTPYVVWVTFALFLNRSIALLNS